MHNGGLLLAPKLHEGWIVEVVDMDSKTDSYIRLELPERYWDLASLLRDMDRFAIRAIYSRAHPGEQIVSVSATRLHNIAGKYTGKDDPVALIRNQGICPAPEELLEPWLIGHYTTGDTRGSHTMPIMVVHENTPVSGFYCLPIVSCLGFSMDSEGRFVHLDGEENEEYVDFFADSTWDSTRLHVQKKGEEMRRQGYFGVAMAANSEIAYTGLMDTLKRLVDEFVTSPDGTGATKVIPAGGR